MCNQEHSFWSTKVDVSVFLQIHLFSEKYVWFSYIFFFFLHVERREIILLSFPKIGFPITQFALKNSRMDTDTGRGYVKRDT